MYRHATHDFRKTMQSDIFACIEGMGRNIFTSYGLVWRHLYHGGPSSPQPSLASSQHGWEEVEDEAEGKDPKVERI